MVYAYLCFGVVWSSLLDTYLSGLLLETTLKGISKIYICKCIVCRNLETKNEYNHYETNCKHAVCISYGYTVFDVSVGLPLLWMRLGPPAFTSGALTLITWHLYRNSHTGVWEWLKCPLVLADLSSYRSWIACMWRCMEMVTSMGTSRQVWLEGIYMLMDNKVKKNTW